MQKIVSVNKLIMLTATKSQIQSTTLETNSKSEFQMLKTPVISVFRIFML